MPERTDEYRILIRTKVDKAGTAEAAKAAKSLQDRFDEVTKSISDMNSVSGEVSAEKLAKMRLALDALGREAEDAGLALEGMDKATRGLDTAGNRLGKIQAEGARLQKSMEGQRRAAETLGFYTQRLGKDFGSLSVAIGPATAALAGGFALGLGVVKKAGVDLTETMDFLDSVVTKVAKGVNWAVGGPFRAFGDWVGRMGREIPDNLLAPLKGLAYANEQARKETERLNRTAESLGVITSDMADKGMAAFVEKVRALGVETKLTDSQVDPLIQEFRRLKDAGAEISDEVDSLARSWGLYGETTSEAEARTKAQAQALEQAAKAADEAAKAAKRKAEEDAKAWEAAVRGGATFGDVLEVEQRKRAAKLETLEFELATGATSKDAAIAVLTEQLQAAQLTEEERRTLILRRQALEKEASEESVRLAESEVEARLRTVEAQIATGDAGLRDLIRAMDQELAHFQGNEEQKRALIRQRTQLAVQAGQAEAAIAGQVAGALMDLGDAAFKNHQEWAIARTRISGAMAIMNVWATSQNPYVAAVLTALIAATTELKVREIEKQKPAASAGVKAAGQEATAAGKAAPSFDDPRNDAAARRAGATTADLLRGAYRGGQVSAVDMLNHHTRGFLDRVVRPGSTGLAGATSQPALAQAPGAVAASGGGGGVTINVSPSLIHPLDEQVKKLRRVLANHDAILERPRRGGRGDRIR